MCVMRYLPLIFLALTLTSCSKPTPLLDRIKAAGELVVLTRNSPTTYYEGRDGLAGPEYELVQLFAEELGVKPRFIVPDSFDEIIPTLIRSEAHVAAAGLTVTTGRESLIRFGPSYQKITQQLVYKSGNGHPRTIEDTAEGILEIVAGSSHEEKLQQLKSTNPNLEWEAKKGIESEELIQLVLEQVIDYTVADSNEVAINQRYYPELKVAFDLTEPQSLAWAFPHAEDSSLYDAALLFFERIKEDGTLKQILERYYGYFERLNFVDKRTFRRHMASRLPRFIPLFENAAGKTGIDWQLLAAIGYQESHWNPRAKSPTGVRGMMMLTLATAKQLGIKNRLDPQQSILGGARYLRLIEEKIPDRVEEPDRLWLALAGYNVGFGHLEDARILTERSGGDPDKWADVKRHLPLLSQKKWYKKTRHGYARGREPVAYVDNIRSYYDLLTWTNDNGDDNETITAERVPITSTPSVL